MRKFALLRYHCFPLTHHWDQRHTENEGRKGVLPSYLLLSHFDSWYHRGNLCYTMCEWNGPWSSSLTFSASSFGKSSLVHVLFRASQSLWQNILSFLFSALSPPLTVIRSWYGFSSPDLAPLWLEKSLSRDSISLSCVTPGFPEFLACAQWMPVDWRTVTRHWPDCWQSCFVVEESRLVKFNVKRISSS